MNYLDWDGVWDYTIEIGYDLVIVYVVCLELGSLFNSSDRAMKYSDSNKKKKKIVLDKH